MRYARSSLDYFSLLKATDKLNPRESARTIRVAILADCAIQQLTTLIKSLGSRNGLLVEAYEGNYDLIDLEILDPDSALYAFDPQFLIVLMSSEKLKARLYESTTDRQSFASETVARIENLWKRSAPIAAPPSCKARSCFLRNEPSAITNLKLRIQLALSFRKSTIDLRNAPGQQRTC